MIWCRNLTFGSIAEMYLFLSSESVLKHSEATRLHDATALLGGRQNGSF